MSRYYRTHSAAALFLPVQQDLYGIRGLPDRLFDGASRYDTDDEHVLSLWADGQTWDIRWPKVAVNPVEPLDVDVLAQITGGAERIRRWSLATNVGTLDIVREAEEIIRLTRLLRGEAAAPTPAPAHVHGQGEICDADCPHWQWAAAPTPAPGKYHRDRVEREKQDPEYRAAYETERTAPTPVEPLALMRLAVEKGCPPDALMDSSPAGQNLRNWWLNDWAPVRERMRDYLDRLAAARPEAER